MLRNNADAHISRLGYLWANKPFIPCFTIMVKIAFTIILSKNLNIMTCLISSLINTLSKAKIKHYIDILGYLKDSNAAAHSVDTGIS